MLPKLWIMKINANKKQIPHSTLVSLYLEIPKQETWSLHSHFHEKTSVTNIISMRLPCLGEISYELRREVQRLVHSYAIIPFQFRFTHGSNKLKSLFQIKKNRSF